MVLCFVARLVQGFSSASIQTTSFSIFGVLYKDNLEAILGYLELSVGLGLTTGPVIGSLLFETGGFICPFLFYAFIFTCFGLFLNRILPESADC